MYVDTFGPIHLQSLMLGGVVVVPGFLVENHLVNYKPLNYLYYYCSLLAALTNSNAFKFCFLKFILILASYSRHSVIGQVR